MNYNFDDGVYEVIETRFLKKKLKSLNTYVPNVTAALINNYECYLSGGGDSKYTGFSFDINNLIDYTPCFWNLTAFPITPTCDNDTFC